MSLPKDNFLLYTLKRHNYKVLITAPSHCENKVLGEFELCTNDLLGARLGDYVFTDKKEINYFLASTRFVSTCLYVVRFSRQPFNYNYMNRMPAFL